MENLQSKIDIRKMKNKVGKHIDFWKGITLGTMAGMTIAAFTYAIVDPAIKEPGRKRSASAPKLGSQAAA
jgi:hypothetical protein